MKKLLLLAALITTLSGSYALAEGFDQALKFLKPTDLETLTAANAVSTADYIYVYDASADNIVKVLYPDMLQTGADSAEMDYLDITTLGTGAASKAVVLDASGDYTFPAAATIAYAAGGTLKINSTDGTALSAIRVATDTDLDNGQTSEVVTVTGATTATVCLGSITNDTTTEVSITSIVTAANQATVQVSADPGASGADLALVCFN